MKLESVNDFQQRLFYAALRAMQLGVRIDMAKKQALSRQLVAAAEGTMEWIEDVVGHPLNPRSAPTMQKLFYEDFAQKVVMTRAKPGQPSRPTCDDEALELIGRREPLLAPLCNKILHWRSLMTLQDNFLSASVSEDDGRMRSSYNICGTETYRFSSSEDAFSSGMNLQNIPHKGSKSYLKAVERGETLPNLKLMFVPDPDWTFFEIDLERADLHVVVWEANDQEMKAVLREGADIHTENAKILGCNREMAKSWVHGTNYGGSPTTMARACGISIHMATQYQKRWFAAHPGILQWHIRVAAELNKLRCVSNKFGYVRHYFDRPDTLLPKALAWIPQSTVACVINRAWVNLYDNLYKDVHVLLQVHDSLAGQYPTSRKFTPQLIRDYSRIIVPYPDPLIIPITMKTSTSSWGECAPV